MTDADLKALFAQDEPPARDPVFQAAVTAEVIRRRFVIDMALLATACTAVGFLIWAVWPALAPMADRLVQGLAPVGACLTLAAVAVAVVDLGVSRALPRNHG